MKNNKKSNKQSQNTGMEFGIEKSARLVRNSGKLTNGMGLPNQEKIRTHEEKEANKYFGILENDTIKEVKKKEKIERVSQENQKATQDKII